MSERLKEMLRIARAATRGPWRVEDPMGPEILFIITDEHKHAYEWLHVAQLSGVPDDDDDIPAEKAKANAQHIATFNPRTAEALVKVALAAAVVYGKAPTHSVNMEDWIALGDALTAAMASEDGQSPTEGLSEAKPSEEDNSNVG